MAGGPLQLACGCEEFQSDSVWILETQGRSVGRLHQPAVLDANFVEMVTPLEQARSIMYRESDVVEAGIFFIKALTRADVMLGQPQSESASEGEDSACERAVSHVPTGFSRPES